MDSSTEWWTTNGLGWTKKTHAITGAGSHTLQWYYSKGGSGTPADGGVWVDLVEWEPEGSAPTLAESLDCDLTITTGGDNSNWVATTTPSYYGGDAALGGGIQDDEQVWMQTTVDVDDGETVSFYWKVSSESGSDYLKFYIDDDYQNEIGGEIDWQKKVYTLSGAGEHTLKWIYDKDASGYTGEDCGWVDGLVIGTGSLIPPPNEFGEALDCDMYFTTSGTDAYWTVASGMDEEYYYETDCARSHDNIANDNECSLQTIVESDSAETVKFYWKVSPYVNGDASQPRGGSQCIALGIGLVVCALLRHIRSSGGNPDRRCSSQPEALGADQEVTNGLKHSKKRLLQGVSRPCGLQRAVNTEQAPKTLLRKPTRHNNGEGRRRRRRGEKRILRFCRGSGGSTYGTDLMCNKGSLPGCP